MWDKIVLDKVCDEFHNENTLLEKFEIGMITGFPLYYMHLVCLGVMKKMIGLLTSGRVEKFRLSSMMCEQISVRINTVASTFPCKVNRRVRSIEDFCRWKATKFRSFLLYIGHNALKGVLQTDYYNHDILLQTVCSIFSPELIKNIKIAETLLVKFVKQFGHLYGAETLVYNVHNLIHLADNAKR